MSKLDNEPLVLSLLWYITGALRIIIQTLSTILWYPLCFVITGMQMTLLATYSPVLYWAITPIRALFALLTYPIMIGYTAIPSYFVYHITMQDGTLSMILSTITTFIVSISLLITGHKTTTDQFPIRFRILFSKTFQVQVELICFILSLLSLVTLTRSVFLIASLKSITPTNMSTSRFCGICVLSVFLTGLDLVTFPFFVLAHVLLVRWKSLSINISTVFTSFLDGKETPKLKVYNDSYQYDPHSFYFYICFMSIFEWILYAITIPILVLTVHRIVPFLKKIWVANDNDRAWMTWEEFIQVLLDIPFAILFILIICFPWRYYFLWKAIQRKKPTDSVRGLIFEQFCYGFCDPILMICLILLFITWYRWNDLMKVYKDTGYLHSCAIDYSLNVLYDVFIHLVCLPLLIPSWRCLDVWKRWKAAPNDKKSQVVISVLIEYLVDLVPFTLLAILSFYRLPLILWFIVSKWSTLNAIEIRKECLNQFYRFLLDIPLTFSLIILTLTGYRFTNMLKRIKNREEKQSWHDPVFQEFGLFLQDLPYMILTVLTIWRIPLVLYHVFFPSEDIENRQEYSHKVVVSQFKGTLLDIPAFLSLILLTLSIYRLICLLRSERRERSNHKMIFDETFELLVDIPFILCAICSIWRIPIILFKALRSEDSSAPSRRSLAVNQMIETLLDIPFLVSFVLMIISLIHLPTLKHFWKVCKRDFRKQVIQVGLILPLHLPLIVVAYLQFVIVWRIPTIIRIGWNSKDKSEMTKAALQQILIGCCDVFALIGSFILFISVSESDKIIQVWKEKSIFVASSELGIALEFHFAVFELLFALAREILFRGTLKRLLFWIFHRLIEVPYVFLALIVLCTCYRSKNLFRKGKMDWKRNVSNEFYELLLDVPYIVGASFSMLFGPWKLYNFLLALFFIKNNNERRNVLMQMIAWTIVDFFCFIMFLVVLICFWRIPFLIYEIIWNKAKVRAAIQQEFVKAIDDLLIFIGVSILLYTINQIPHFIATMYQYMKRILSSISCKSKKTRITSGEDNGMILKPTNVYLPQEMFQEIFSHLDAKSICKNVEPVCKNWYQMTKEPPMWQIQCERFQKRNTRRLSTFSTVWSQGFDTSSGWKDEFIHSYQMIHPPKPKKKTTDDFYDLEYAKGIRTILHQEIVLALQKLLLFFVLPLKLLGIFVIPLFAYNIVRLKLMFNKSARQDNLFAETIGHFTRFEFQYFAYNVLTTFAYLVFTDLRSLGVVFYQFVIYTLFLYYPVWKSILDALPKSSFQNLVFFIKRFVINLWQLLTYPFILSFELVLLAMPFFYPVRLVFVRDFSWMLDYLFIPSYRVSTVKIYLQPYVWVLNSYFVLVEWILYLFSRFVWSREWAQLLLFYSMWIMYVLSASISYRLLLSHTFNEYHPERLIMDILVYTFDSMVRAFYASIRLVSQTLTFFLKLYGNILWFFVVFAKKTGLLGDLLLIPVTLIWMFWPLCIPWYVKIYSLYIPALILCTQLIFYGNQLIRNTK